MRVAFVNDCLAYSTSNMMKAALAGVIRGRSSLVTIDDALGAPAGGNRITSTSGRVENALRILGSTSAQFKPPFPQPRGGTAMDLISSSLTTATKSTNPVSM